MATDGARAAAAELESMEPGGKSTQKKPPSGTMCEDCGQKRATFALPSEGPSRPPLRWCSGCAKIHEGAVSCNFKKCEDCGIVRARYYMPGTKTTTSRWCTDCATAHPGALRDSRRAPGSRRKCEDCDGKGDESNPRMKSVSCDGLVPIRNPTHGLESDGWQARWCHGCSSRHAGADWAKKSKRPGGGKCPKKNLQKPDAAFAGSWVRSGGKVPAPTYQSGLPKLNARATAHAIAGKTKKPRLLEPACGYKNAPPGEEAVSRFNPAPGMKTVGRPENGPTRRPGKRPDPPKPGPTKKRKRKQACSHEERMSLAAELFAEMTELIGETYKAADVRPLLRCSLLHYPRGGAVHSRRPPPQMPIKLPVRTVAMANKEFYEELEAMRDGMAAVLGKLRTAPPDAAAIQKAEVERRVKVMEPFTVPARHDGTAGSRTAAVKEEEGKLAGEGEGEGESDEEEDAGEDSEEEDDEQVTITLPAGVAPGETIWVDLPPRKGRPSAKKQVPLVIPPGYRAGSAILLSADGKMIKKRTIGRPRDFGVSKTKLVAKPLAVVVGTELGRLRPYDNGNHQVRTPHSVS